VRINSLKYGSKLNLITKSINDIISHVSWLYMAGKISMMKNKKENEASGVNREVSCFDLL
jgi:ArsR family metal-binding transcriptional regulator